MGDLFHLEVTIIGHWEETELKNLDTSEKINLKIKK